MFAHGTPVKTFKCESLLGQGPGLPNWAIGFDAAAFFIALMPRGAVNSGMNFTNFDGAVSGDSPCNEPPRLPYRASA